MKLLNTTLTFLIFILSLLLSFNSNAITYTTINPGSWSSVTNVWSTDGGVTPCGCTPGASSGANNIVINHNVAIPCAINITAGGNLQVNTTGKMNGNFDFTVSDAVVNIYGKLNMKKYVQNGTSTVDLHPGAVVIFSNQSTINGGVLNLNGAVINSGRLETSAGSTINLSNSARYLVTTGNSTIGGQFNIDSTSCTETNGNWKVNPSGEVLGGGAFSSGGNINNNGTVHPAVKWCANGAGLGMPSAEDCAGAMGVCNAIVLSVEINSFEATVYDNRYAEVTWSTVSENNNSHFIVMSSRDMENWTEEATIYGAGTTSTEQNYSYADFNLEVGTTYYKLFQVDNNGHTNQLDPIAIIKVIETKELISYPTPVLTGSSLKIFNAQNGEEPRNYSI